MIPEIFKGDLIEPKHHKSCDALPAKTVFMRELALCPKYQKKHPLSLQEGGLMIPQKLANPPCLLLDKLHDR